MRCSRCGKCCQRTEMELSSGDIKNLEETGFCREEFTVMDQDDVPRLRNVDESCFFYDVSKKRCRVYTHRPLGCRLYPVIYSIDGDTVVIDDVCPKGGTVSEQEMGKKGRILSSLLKAIDIDAEARRSRKN